MAVTHRDWGKVMTRELREALAEPMFNPVLKTYVGNGELDYERYVRTTDLLSLQSKHDELSDPDELMFQVVHQAQELWLKLIGHELAEVVDDLDRDDLWPVAGRLERLVRILGCMADELRVLETLTPDTYQVIRRNLGNGSGQESPGYNTVQTAAPYVLTALGGVLDRAGLSLAEVYRTGDPALKRVCEALLDFDGRYQTWLMGHFMLVRRTIGVGRDTKALDGVPARVLTGRMTKPLFGDLWRVRDELTEGWEREGGHVPGAAR